MKRQRSTVQCRRAEPAKYKIGKQIINSGRVTTFSEFSICSEDRCVLIRNLDEYEVGMTVEDYDPLFAGLKCIGNKLIFFIPDEFS